MDVDRLRQLVIDGKDAEAEVAAIGMVNTGPCPGDVYVLLATAARRRGNFETAATALRQATALDPDNASRWRELGDVLALVAQWTEALRAYRTASALAKDDAGPLVALASAQLASQRYADAQRTSSLLLAKFPAAPESHVFSGHLQRSLGRRQSAITAYQRALEIDPGNATALLALTELDPPEPASPLAERIATLLRCEDLAHDQRAQLEFALGRILDHAGQVDHAFSNFERANAAHRRALAEQGVHCRREFMSRWLDTAAQRYTRQQAVPLRAEAAPAVGPIFIVGLPRTGGTLVEQILARHPRVAAGGELPAANLVHARYVRARAQHGLQWPADPRCEIDGRLLADARESYLEQALVHAGEAEYVTDKHPGNAALVGFLRLLFPHSPIICSWREPVATCWSIYTSYLPASSACFTSLEEIAHYHSAHGRLMRFWNSVIDPALIDVQYESLVTDPEVEIRALVSSCGLSWDSACLAPEQTQRAVNTASVDQIRRPIHREAINRHRRYDRHLAGLRQALLDTARAADLVEP
jgi:tetratricopeptide (TPR) repeat protein